MSLEDKIKSSAKFLGLVVLNGGLVYGIQQTVGLLGNTLDYNNLLYPSITGVGLTIAYYLGNK